MRTIVKSLAVVFVVLFGLAAGRAQAALIDYVDLGTLIPHDDYVLKGSLGKGLSSLLNADVYEFSLSQGTSSILADISSVKKLNGLTLTLLGSDTGSWWDWTSLKTVSTADQEGHWVLSYADVAADMIYRLVVTGLSKIGKTGEYAGTLTAAAPLPSAIVLFGLGVLGLGAFGRRFRKGSIMNKVAAALIGVCCMGAVPAQAATVSLDVYAKENSTNGGQLLNTGVYLQNGQTLVVSATGTWSAGSENPSTRISDANGIAEYYGLYGQFLYGTLVGKIGESGDYFQIGTAYSGLVSTSGLLYLGYWDSNNYDNSGSVSATVSAVPLPAAAPLFAAALAGIAFAGRRFRKRAS